MGQQGGDPPQPHGNKHTLLSQIPYTTHWYTVLDLKGAFDSTYLQPTHNILVPLNAEIQRHALSNFSENTAPICLPGY